MTLSIANFIILHLYKINYLKFIFLTYKYKWSTQAYFLEQQFSTWMIWTWPYHNNLNCNKTKSPSTSQSFTTWFIASLKCFLMIRISPNNKNVRLALSMDLIWEQTLLKSKALDMWSILFLKIKNKQNPSFLKWNFSIPEYGHLYSVQTANSSPL